MKNLIIIWFFVYVITIEMHSELDKWHLLYKALLHDPMSPLAETSAFKHPRPHLFSIPEHLIHFIKICPWHFDIDILTKFLFLNHAHMPVFSLNLTQAGKFFIGSGSSQCPLSDALHPSIWHFCLGTFFHLPLSKKKWILICWIAVEGEITEWGRNFCKIKYR